MQTGFEDMSVSPGMPGPVRAMHSLRERHVSILGREVLTWPGSWCLARHEGYDGNLIVVISPADALEPSLVFGRSAAGFHFGVLESDEYREVGCVGSVEALAALAGARILRESGYSHAV